MRKLEKSLRYRFKISGGKLIKGYPVKQEDNKIIIKTQHRSKNFTDICISKIQKIVCSDKKYGGVVYERRL